MRIWHRDDTFARAIGIVVLLAIILAVAIYNFKTAESWDIRPVMTMAEAEQRFEIKILLPSPSELQERVNEVLKQAKKPLIKVDGKVGFAESAFRPAYEEAYCYQQGIYHCEKAGM